MAFADLKYQLKNSQIMLIRMSDEEAAATSPEPTGAVTLPAHVQNSGSRRAFGVHPRGIILSREVGTAPDTFNKTKFLALLTEAAIGSTGYTVGSTITIDGTAWEVKSEVPEKLV